MDRLMNLGGGDYNKDKSGSKAEKFTTGLVERDFGIEEWDWPQGVGLMGLVKLQDYYKDCRYDEFFKAWFERNFEIGLPSRNVNTTMPFFTLLDYAVRNNRKDWIEECRKQADFLMNELPRTCEEGFQHVTSGIGDRNGVILNENQLWIDTIFMAVLFLNKYAHYTNDDACFSECTKQILIHIKYLCDKKSGFMYHGWSFDRKDNFGGIFWGRGNSWFTFGITEFLTASPDLDRGVRRYIENTYRAQVDALLSCQDESGLWHTVLTDPASYCEVSGSAGITAGILRGIKAGILKGEKYQLAAEKGIKAIMDNIAEDGTVLNVSAGTAIGMDAEFYKKIIIRPMAYGQALTLIALVEALD